jgi:TonB family protein
LREAAVWHWQVAQNLAVELRDQPLSAYGPAGELLAPHRLPPSPAGRVPTGSNDEEDAAVPTAAPAVVEAPSPRFPEADLLDLAVVEVEVDEQGRPRAPVALDGRAPGRLYAALEALREWRFEPPAGAQPRQRRVGIPLARLRPLNEIRALHRRLAESTPRSPGEVGPRLHYVQWKEARKLLTAAVKLAERGDRDAALRRWRRAQSLVPALVLADLTPFGPGGELLGRHRVPIAGRWALPPPVRRDAAGEPPPADRPLKVGGEVREPVPVFAPAAEYTPEARAARIEGDVVVEATIDRDGRVRALRVLEGLPMGLTEQALAALSSWRFRPATLDGVAVSVDDDLTVSFRPDQPE